MPEQLPPPEQETPSPSEKFDPYKVLGVSKGATYGEITARYNRLAKASFPGGREDLSEDQRIKMESEYERLGRAYGMLTENMETAETIGSWSSSWRPDNHRN